MSNFVQKSICALNFLNAQNIGLIKYFGDSTIIPKRFVRHKRILSDFTAFIAISSLLNAVERSRCR